MLLLLSIVFFVIVFVLLFLWYRLKKLTGGYSSKDLDERVNVFCRPYLRKEVDQKIEEVHKQIFDEEKIPENIDVIVIGSGIAGLTCSSFLSKEGLKVLLLDQNEQAGGFTHVFSEKGYEWSTGVHYLTNCNKGSIFELIFKYVSDNQLKMVDFNPMFDQLHVMESNKVYEVRTGPEYIEYLVEQFPKEEENIRFFWSEIEQCLSESGDLMMLRSVNPTLRSILKRFKATTFQKYQKMTIREAVEERFQDNDLRLIFAYMVALLGHPQTVPASVLMNCVGGYNRGASYPGGGAGSFGRTICHTIEKYGGKVMNNAKVERVIIQDGKAIGVKIEGAKRPVLARKIVGAMGVYNNHKVLGGKYFKEMRSRYVPSLTHFYVFLGFNQNAEKLKVPEHNVFYFQSYDSIFNDIKWLEKVPEESDEDVPGFFIAFTDYLNPNPDRNKCSAIVMCQAKYEWFEKWNDLKLKFRGNEYKDLKQVITDKLLNVVFRMFPQIEEHLDYCDSGSPCSVNHWMNTTWGESYGFKNVCDSLFENIKFEVDGVENYYVTGADYFYARSVIGGALAGVQCAEKITGVEYVKHAVQKMRHDYRMRQKEEMDSEGKKE